MCNDDGPVNEAHKKTVLHESKLFDMILINITEAFNLPSLFTTIIVDFTLHIHNEHNDATFVNNVLCYIIVWIQLTTQCIKTHKG